VAQESQIYPVPPTNPYVLDQPQVSGDGTLLIYRGTLFCGEGSRSVCVSQSFNSARRVGSS